MEKTKKRRFILISFLVVVITFFYYFTFFQYAHPEYAYYHTLFRDLWFLPLMLAGLWFGLKGALRTSLGITVLYMPYIVVNWQGMSPRDFNRMLEIVLLNAVAAVIGAVSSLQKARERALRESESLAAMGTALSAIAHDMKNPLVAIGGFARLLREKDGIDDDSWRKLGFIVEGTNRLEALVRDMLDFSRPLNLTLAKEDINEAVRDSVMTLESKARESRASITLELSQDLPLVTFDRVRMVQVFLNLVDNAIEASPEGKAVVVRTLHEGGKTLIDVADGGSGISPEHRGEIFTPFFTTKRHGTGLGLAIVLKIVEAHGGEVRALQTQERGATFRVSLPSAK